MNNPIPSLETARLHLRGFTLADVTPMHHLLQSADVLRYFPKPQPPSLLLWHGVLLLCGRIWQIKPNR